MVPGGDERTLLPHCSLHPCAAAGRGLPASDRPSQSTPRAFNRHCARLGVSVNSIPDAQSVRGNFMDRWGADINQ